MIGVCMGSYRSLLEKGRDNQSTRGRCTRTLTRSPTTTPAEAFQTPARNLAKEPGDWEYMRFVPYQEFSGGRMAQICSCPPQRVVSRRGPFILGSSQETHPVQQRRVSIDKSKKSIYKHGTRKTAELLSAPNTPKQIGTPPILMPVGYVDPTNPHPYPG